MCRLCLLEFLFTLSSYFEYSFVFCFFVKFHPIAPLTTSINLVFLEFYFSHCLKTLYLPLECFQCLFVSRTKIIFISVSMYYVLFNLYSEDFSGLGLVVFVPLIEGFHDRSLVCLLSCILFIFRLSEFFGLLLIKLLLVLSSGTGFISHAYFE